MSRFDIQLCEYFHDSVIFDLELFILYYNIDQNPETQCSEYRGCKNNQCWRYCGSSQNSGHWCYSTTGKAYDGNRAACEKLEDCDKCWQCADSCALL